MITASATVSLEDMSTEDAKVQISKDSISMQTTDTGRPIRINGWMDGRTDGRTDGRVDGWIKDLTGG